MREHYAGSRTSPGDVLKIAGSVQDDPERNIRPAACKAAGSGACIIYSFFFHHAHISRAYDLIHTYELLDAMGAPADYPGNCKDRCI